MTIEMSPQAVSSSAPSPASSRPVSQVPENGKREWSWDAAQGMNVPKEGRDTVPETDGGFADLIDIINPLQHIPIVGNIYRALTGDTINPAGRILGGTLFGGPLGFLSGVGGTLMAQATGGDVGEHLLASLFGGNSSTNSANSSALVASRYDASARLRI